MRYTKDNLLAYKDKILAEMKSRRIPKNPTSSEVSLMKLISFIDEKAEEVQKEFNLPASINALELIETLLSNKDLDTIYTGYAGDEPDYTEEPQPVYKESKINIHYLSIFDIVKKWKKNQQVIMNFKSCIKQLEEMKADDIVKLRNVLLSGNPYPLTGGSISAAYKMVANSVYANKLDSKFFFIEFRINSKDAAQYRVYGAFTKLNEDNPNLYLSSVYTKNAGQAQADTDFDNILLRFINASSEIKEGWMDRVWVDNLDEVLQDNSLFEELDCIDTENKLLAEEAGMRDAFHGVKNRSYKFGDNKDSYNTGYNRGKRYDEVEYVSQETLDLIHKIRNSRASI